LLRRFTQSSCWEERLGRNKTFMVGVPLEMAGQEGDRDEVHSADLKLHSRQQSKVL
jgi:hypothetical protein